MFGVVLPGLFEECASGRHLVGGFGQAHQGGRGRTDGGPGVGTHAVFGFFAEHLQHALGHAKADGGKPAVKIRAVRRVENLAVGIKAETCGLAFHHVLGFLDAMLGHPGVVDDEGLGATALHAGGEPIVTDLVVTARQHGEAVILAAFGVLPTAADNRPLAMVTAAAPAHFTTEVHTALALHHPAKRRNTAAGGGVRVFAPDLLL